MENTLLVEATNIAVYVNTDPATKALLYQVNYFISMHRLAIEIQKSIRKSLVEEIKWTHQYDQPVVILPAATLLFGRYRIARIKKTASPKPFEKCEGGQRKAKEKWVIDRIK